MRLLKVFGWQGWRSECPPALNGNKQTREVVAAKSKAEVARIAGKKYANQLFNLGETGNSLELQLALSKPGVIFWAPIDSRDYREEK